MSYLTYNLEENLAIIRLNRPEKYNSFIRPMALELIEKLQESRDNEAVRAIYITGIGKAFCAGQDLQEAIDPEGPEISTILAEHYNPIITLIRTIEKPIVIAVNGVAAGAGANIALAADVLVAHEKASFIQAFSKIGLIPDSAGTWTLPRLIGMQRASAIMMLGDKINAIEAEKMGMIYKYFPEDTFETESLAIAHRLSKMPTFALGLTKRALNQSFENSLEKQLGIEEVLQTSASNSEDYKEGVNAFLEKREPQFTGK